MIECSSNRPLSLGFRMKFSSIMELISQMEVIVEKPLQSENENTHFPFELKEIIGTHYVFSLEQTSL